MRAQELGDGSVECREARPTRPHSESIIIATTTVIIPISTMIITIVILTIIFFTTFSCRGAPRDAKAGSAHRASIATLPADDAVLNLRRSHLHFSAGEDGSVVTCCGQMVALNEACCFSFSSNLSWEGTSASSRRPNRKSMREAGWLVSLPSARSNDSIQGPAPWHRG